MPTFTIRPNYKVVGVGDSLTFFGWATVEGGLVDQINAQIGTTQIGNRRPKVAGAGAFPKVGSTAAKIQGGAIEYINRGVSGWSSHEIEQDAAIVVSFKPDAIILSIGINDATLGVSAEDYRTNIDSALDAYQNAGISEILFVSPLVCGEFWTSAGPSFAGNGFDAAIDAIIVQAQESCAAHGVLFVELRPEALAYIIANGPVEPGASFGTLVDSTQKHPIVPSGQLWMSDQVIPHVTVVP